MMTVVVQQQLRRKWHVAFLSYSAAILSGMPRSMIYMFLQLSSSEFMPTSRLKPASRC